jgi:hypothetical protein
MCNNHIKTRMTHLDRMTVLYIIIYDRIVHLLYMTVLYIVFISVYDTVYLSTTARGSLVDEAR